MNKQGPEDSNDKKTHRERHSGRKAQKKKEKSQIEQDDKQRNPKAFAFNSAIRAERRFRRKQDINTKKQHVPLVDRTPLEPPPILIAVVGPPKVGKSTLINNLIKLFTRAPLTEIKGPVTLVTGKKRRLTFMECNNDINSMIDLAKIADLVLLLCDASFGFEMEIFEFLNICQNHGMPKIMGVLTHLDMIKNAKTLKATKKTLKHRFWTEVYQGAKLFYLSGIVHEEYLRNEVKNLGRFISVMKLRPLTWRTNHGYLLADRYEDLTNQELLRNQPNCDRTISLYGYVRGAPVKKNSFVHVAGLGDSCINDISFLPDPCPLPDEIKKRALVEKEKLIYAPFSGVGGIVYDKDAVYVDLGGSHSFAKRGDESDDIVANLIETKETLDVKMEQSKIRLFAGGEEFTGGEFEENGGNYGEDRIIEEDGRIRRKVVFQDEVDVASESEDSDVEADSLDDDEYRDVIYIDTPKNVKKPEQEKLIDDNEEVKMEGSDEDTENEESEDDGGMKWKDNLAEKAQSAFLERQNNKQNLMKLVYGIFDMKKTSNEDVTTLPDEEENEEIGGLFRKTSQSQQKLKLQKDTMNLLETSLMLPWNAATKNWLNDRQSIVNCFVTGQWKESENAEDLLKLDDLDDSEMFGDFEDLETGEQNKTNEDLLEKKMQLKERFDQEYDNKDKDSYYDDLKQKAETQAILNKSEFTNISDDVRVQLEGYRPGMYVRIELSKIPAEFVSNFDATYPILIGALNIGEENVGFVNVKIKRHRWFKKTLKTLDPLIISLGWRRFQTLPMYSKLEDDLKFRYLKYIPEHVGCNGHFWGPITPQGSGFIALQKFETDPVLLKRQGFRIAASGTVQELDKSTQIMKKLKLVGHPFKIYKKTAFIKNMFNTSLEVAKFEGARIKTVSGIRGQIKKAISKPEGCFRATFEDKILLSDIVFCRTWYKVDVPKFYNPVTTLLEPPNRKNQWKGVRTTGEVKREKSIKNLPNEDSLYTAIQRTVKPFRPLVIPGKLQRALPYKDKPKNSVKNNERKRKIDRVAVVREPHEQKINKLMKMVKTNYEFKQDRLRNEMKERMEKHRKLVEAQQNLKDKKLKEKKKEVFRKRSKAQKGKQL